MSNPSTTLVVSRYNEPIDWLLRVPNDFRIVVHNKGTRINDPELEDRVDQILDRKNQGRESESFLSHILENQASPTDWTIFTQADPFPHSPDFLSLLDLREEWQEIQPLSVQYLAENEVPPRALIHSDQGEFIKGHPVRSEHYSLRTLLPFTFNDIGAQRIADFYRKGHDLSSDQNLIRHFIELTGWGDLADLAGEADFGTFAYGAIFAVKVGCIGRIPPEVIDRMLVLANGHSVYGFIFERLWLHFFGFPFYSLGEGVSKPRSMLSSGSTSTG